MTTPSEDALRRAREVAHESVNNFHGMCRHGRHHPVCDTETTAIARAIDAAVAAEREANKPLRELVEQVRDEFTCLCEPDEGEDAFDGPVDCPCGGDDCWKCAATQALEPPPWRQAAILARGK
jgi:hypothetical protein